MVPDREPRGNWGVGIAALFGLVTIAFGAGSWLTSLYYDPSDRHPGYQQEAGEVGRGASLASARPAIQTLEEKEPCRQPQGKDESDLCAQWRAAKAGERAAFWALIQMVLSAFGVAGLVATLWFTKDALTVAREANATASRIGEAQVRCYVSVMAATLRISEDGIPHISIKLKNFGQSPALQLECHFTARFNVLKSGEIDFGFGEEETAEPLAIPAGTEVDTPPLAYLHGFSDHILSTMENGRYVSIDIGIRFLGMDAFGEPIKGGGMFNAVHDDWQLETDYTCVSADAAVIAMRNELARRKRRRASQE